MSVELISCIVVMSFEFGLLTIDNLKTVGIRKCMHCKRFYIKPLYHILKKIFLNNEHNGNALFARKMWLKFRNLFTHILVAVQHAKKKWNIWKKNLSELELKVSGFLFSTQIIHYFMSLNHSQPNSKILEYLGWFSSEGRKSAPLLFSIVKKD